MGTGRNNKLVGQVGEFLVCAELGRRDYIATPFSGNVPEFDVLAVDHQCRSAPIQVKAATGKTWLTDVRTWMDVSLDEQTGKQTLIGPKHLVNPNLIYAHVWVSETASERDRYFLLTKRDLQNLCIKVYTEWMIPHEWRRPKKQDSYHLAYTSLYLKPFENNWDLIKQQLSQLQPTVISIESNVDEAEKVL